MVCNNLGAPISRSAIATKAFSYCLGGCGIRGPEFWLPPFVVELITYKDSRGVVQRQEFIYRLGSVQPFHSVLQ